MGVGAGAESERPAKHPKAATHRTSKQRQGKFGHNPKAGQRKAKHHSSDAEFPESVEGTPAYRYAQLSRDACLALLTERRLPITEDAVAHEGLDAPVRVTGPLHGVTLSTQFRDDDGGPSVYSLLDCRLVLALDDFSQKLSALGVTEIQFSSAYRPPAKGSTGGEPGRRHAGGLAIDVHRIRTEAGGWLSVDKDFHGRLGAKVCGNRSVPPWPNSPVARLLRQVACMAHESRLFQSVLTPNYDRAHHNHLHLEVTRGVRWFLIS